VVVGGRSDERFFSVARALLHTRSKTDEEVEEEEVVVVVGGAARESPWFDMDMESGRAREGGEEKRGEADAARYLSPPLCSRLSLLSLVLCFKRPSLVYSLSCRHHQRELPPQ
jgi:hypothetical protein